MAAMAYVGKILITIAFIVAITEVANRSNIWAAVLASIPLTTVLSMIWMHQDGRDLLEISQFVKGIAFLLIPSFIALITFPILVKKGFEFYPSLAISITLTIVGYLIMVKILEFTGWASTNPA